MIHSSLYEPPDSEIEALLSRASVGRLVTVGPDGVPCVGLYPFVIDGSIIEIHLNKHDEQVAHLREHPTCAFEVDEVLGHIPSYWIDPDNAVYATAYHRTVQFACAAELTEDAYAIAQQQNRLMAAYQPEGRYRPVTPDDPMYAGMVGLLVGFTLTVTSRKAKFKLAQNRTPEIRRTIIANLRARSSGTDHAAADALHATLNDSSQIHAGSVTS